MYAIIDVETTGLRGEDNRITEIAIAIHDGKKVIEDYHTLINPEIPISPYVTGLTGIDDSMVQEAPVFKEIAPTINELTQNRIFVAHNVSFDYNVIRSEFKRIGTDYKRKRLCTVRLSRKIFPGYRSYSLGNLCRSLQIPILNRHRAKGDTDATVILFEKLLANDTKDVFGKLLNQRSKELTLPPMLPASVFENLPETPGVYYFLNKAGKVIYVGKAINIKKRVLGHFYDKKARELAMAGETVHVDFEETGNELLALLVESAKIKQYYPKYNQAQKQTVKGYGIISYTDRKGIVHLGYTGLKMANTPLKICHTITECLSFLAYLCEAYELCPKYTHLQENVPHCSHYKLRDCRGVCREKESVDDYNKRVYSAIKSLTVADRTFIIVEKGRAEKEKSLIWIDNGSYRGYAFIDSEETISDPGRFEDFLIPQQSNLDTDRIIQSYMQRKSDIELITLPDDRTN